MFWKRKETAAAPVNTGATPTAEVKPSAAKVEAPPQPKAEKPKVDKLPGPTLIPGFVGKHLIAEFKVDPALVPVLNAVVRKSPKAEKLFDCRIFDKSEVEASEVRIKDYMSLDEHPELILYEGWFDEGSKRVQLEEKRKVAYDVQIFTETEIWQRIVGLSEPGSTVFFYLAGSPSSGGPLGRGAAVVEPNPNYPGPKQKRYILYTANVMGMQPIGKGTKFFESNSSKEMAKWIKDRHYKRMW